MTTRGRRDVSTCEEKILASHRLGSFWGVFNKKGDNSKILRRFGRFSMLIRRFMLLQEKFRATFMARFRDDSILVREGTLKLIALHFEVQTAYTSQVANALFKPLLVCLPACLHDGISVRKRIDLILRRLRTSNENKGKAKACATVMKMASDPKEGD